MRFWFDNLACHSWLPEGKSGNWSVRRRIVEGDREEWKRLGMDENGDCSPPGVYTELYEGETRRMSDDVFLLNRDRKFCASAHGHILLTGLGLGITARWLTMNSSVERIHVIEHSLDVLKLVGQHLPVGRIDFSCADAYEYQAEGHYDLILHDCFDEQPVRVSQLMANYQHCTAWQGVSTYVH